MTFEQFIASIPKPILVLCILLLGLGVFILSDPPRTICDGHIEQFREQQRETLYATSKESGLGKRGAIKALFETCQADNSPGGCFEFFARLRKLAIDIDRLPSECSESAANEEVLKLWLFKGLQLMSEIAWGDHGPATSNTRNGWFDSADISLFCRLHRLANRLYGKEAMLEWRNSLLDRFRGADTMNREQVYSKSMFSVNCSGFD